MPPTFTGSFAKRLNDITHFDVSETKGGEIISGRVFIAPEVPYARPAQWRQLRDVFGTDATRAFSTPCSRSTI